MTTVNPNSTAFDALTTGDGHHGGNGSPGLDLSQYCQNLLKEQTLQRRSDKDTVTQGQEMFFCQARGGDRTVDPTAGLPQEARNYLRDTLHMQSASLDQNGRLRVTFDQARYHNFGNDTPPVWFDRSVTGNATVGDNNVRLAGLEGVQVRPPYSPLYVYVTDANFVKDGNNYYADVTAGIGAHATVRVPITQEIYDQIRAAATSNRPRR